MQKFSLRNLLILFAITSLIIFTVSSCGKKEADDKAKMEEIKKMEQKYDNFVKPIEETLKGLYHNSALAGWNAAVSGTKEDFKISADCDMAMNAFFANKPVFDSLKKFKESNLIKDTLKSRQLILLYNSFLSNQIDTAKLNAMTQLQNEITQKFQNFRAKVGGKELTDNDIEKNLATLTDSKKLKETWEAHKNIGPLVSEDLVKLVKMRNGAAKELGFKNYHEMSLKLSEQDPEEILKLFDELDALTKDSFKSLIAEMNTVLAKKCNIKPEELMPWHYQNRFFQEAPSIYDVDLDKYYKDKDIVALTETYYKSIGLPIEDMVAKSDLFEKSGKNQHAFCTDIDRDTKDVRVLCNIKDNSKWMNTMLHEYGHAIYTKNHGETLPWTLKTAAHIFTTEAIAMLFGRFASNAQWMQDMLGISNEEGNKIAETCHKYLRLEQLVFSRWSQVMYRFEKSLYENPDQDLNKLWWDLVEKYQMIKRPVDRNMPDWATKIHIANSPCYYHNYHLGELFASQLYYHIKDKLLKTPEGKDASFYQKPEVGKYLIDNVFAPGAKYKWDDMILKATGEKLTAKYYAKQFVK